MRHLFLIIGWLLLTTGCVTEVPTGDARCPCAQSYICCPGSNVCRDDLTMCPEVCGDNILQEGEACDDGPANSNTAACTQTCTEATCGDGLVWAGREDCDDAGESSTCNVDCTTALCGRLVAAPASAAGTGRRRRSPTAGHGRSSSCCPSVFSVRRSKGARPQPTPQIMASVSGQPATNGHRRVQWWRYGIVCRSYRVQGCSSWPRATSRVVRKSAVVPAVTSRNGSRSRYGCRPAT